MLADLLLERADVPENPSPLVGEGRLGEAERGEGVPVSHNPKRAFGIQKPSIQYVPPAAILAEAEAMAAGAKKYGPFNWRDESVDASTYYSAAFRHMAAWFSGEDLDPETGLSHLAHARASLGILIDAQATGSLIDDRPRAAATA